MRSSESRNPLSTVIIAGSLALGLSVGLVSTPAHAVGELSLPQWADLFNPDGSHKDELDGSGTPVPGGNGISDYLDLGALDAIFIEDNISDDLATDMSARLGAPVLADDLVFNDTVTALYDLGNSYVLANWDTAGDLQIYAGVELLSAAGESPPADTYLEIEFNLDRVQVCSGNPWPIHGQRSDGDLLVHMNFTQGALSSVEFKHWETGSGFQIDATATIQPGDTEPCHGGATPYVICTGTPPLDPPVGGFEVWDLDGNQVASVPPDGFVEVGLDVAGLLGSNPDFTSISVRTPEDIALSAFRALGYWGGVNALQDGG